MLLRPLQSDSWRTIASISGDRSAIRSSKPVSVAGRALDHPPHAWGQDIGGVARMRGSSAGKSQCGCPSAFCQPLSPAGRSTATIPLGHRTLVVSANFRMLESAASYSFGWLIT